MGVLFLRDAAVLSSHPIIKLWLSELYRLVTQSSSDIPDIPEISKDAQTSPDIPNI